MKSQKLQTKLAIALETEKEKTVKKDIVFNDTKVTQRTAKSIFVFFAFYSVFSVFFFFFFISVPNEFECLSPEKGGFLSTTAANEEQALRKA